MWHSWCSNFRCFAFPTSFVPVRFILNLKQIFSNAGIAVFQDGSDVKSQKAGIEQRSWNYCWVKFPKGWKRSVRSFAVFVPFKYTGHGWCVYCPARRFWKQWCARCCSRGRGWVVKLARKILLASIKRSIYGKCSTLQKYCLFRASFPLSVSLFSFFNLNVIYVLHVNYVIYVICQIRATHRIGNRAL